MGEYKRVSVSIADKSRPPLVEDTLHDELIKYLKKISEIITERLEAFQAQQGLGPNDVLNELGRRFGISGIEEKASRNKS